MKLHWHVVRKNNFSKHLDMGKEDAPTRARLDSLDRRDVADELKKMG
jgi:hypothetical protein